MSFEKKNFHFFLWLLHIWLFITSTDSSNSVAFGLQFYLSHKFEIFKGCEGTIIFCKRINDLFEALNRKQTNQGHIPDSKDFKVYRW